MTMTGAKLTVYTDQGGPFDSSTMQPIIWDGNPGGLEGHIHQLDDWTDESKFRQLMSTGVTTTSGGKTICVNSDIPNIVETEREIVSNFPEFADEFTYSSVKPPPSTAQRIAKISWVLEREDAVVKARQTRENQFTYLTRELSAHQQKTYLINHLAIHESIMELLEVMWSTW